VTIWTLIWPGTHT